MDFQASALLAAGICAFGFLGASIGMGLLFGKYIETVGRQPNAEGKVKVWLFVGMALVEQFGIFALLVALILLFVKT